MRFLLKWLQYVCKMIKEGSVGLGWDVDSVIYSHLHCVNMMLDVMLDSCGMWETTYRKPDVILLDDSRKVKLQGQKNMPTTVMAFKSLIFLSFCHLPQLNF